MKNYSIKQHFTIPYNPRGNSIIERSHHTLVNQLRILKYMNITDAIKTIPNAFYSTVSTATGYSPMQLAFGRAKFNISKTENL